MTHPDPNARAMDLARKILSGDPADQADLFSQALLTYGRERWNAALEEGARRCENSEMFMVNGRRRTGHENAAALRAMKETSE